MSLIPKSWTGVDELRDEMWKLVQKVELLEMLYAGVPQPRPTPTPERALNAAAVLADAIAKHDDKAPDVSPALEFYNAAGGYAWFKRYVTTFSSVVNLYHRADVGRKHWYIRFGRTVKGRAKSKTFATRREAEQFAFDVLTIHEAECIKRKAPTDWWSRVKIFEVVKR